MVELKLQCQLPIPTLDCPCPCPSLRKGSTRKGHIEPWKIHLLQLVNEVPLANGIICKDETEREDDFLRNSNSMLCLLGSVGSGSRSSSPGEVSLRGLKFGGGTSSEPTKLQNKDSKEVEENKSKAIKSPYAIIPGSIPIFRFPRITSALFESRVRSLRLEIGDLSVPENLAKLCNHYFQLKSENNQHPNAIKSDLECENNIVEAEASLLLLNEKLHCNVKSGSNLSSEGKTSVSTFPSQQGITISQNSSQYLDSSNSTNESLNVSAYGNLFHGLLTKSQTQNLLKEDGHYLIRQMANQDSFILSFRFEDEIRNYKIFYDKPEVGSSGSGGSFYLVDRKKKYSSLEELVQDGLTTLFLVLRAGFYLDMMTELVEINKQDENFLSPTSGGGVVGIGEGIGSRRNSAIGDSIRKVVSQVEFYQQNRLSKALNDFPSESDSKEMELRQHWFVEVKLEKKSKCESEVCLKHCRSLKFSKKVLVCKDCGMTIHEKCLENVLNDSSNKCYPKGKIKSIFGTDLTILVKATRNDSNNSDWEYKAPFILVKCIEEIEKRGFQSEGLYRISGYQSMIAEIQKSFEKDREATDLSKFPDINSLCGVVKLFLRLLPEPLITSDVFESFVNENEGFVTLESVKKHLKMLPAAHSITLKYLLEHLHRVSKERELNKMGAFNLSSVLSQSIIVPEEISLNILKLGTDVVEIMIKNVYVLFCEPKKDSI